jgi:putative multiple sugar transport system permease protein
MEERLSTQLKTTADGTPVRYAGFLKSNIREYGMLISLIAIMAFFQVMTDGTLMRPLNLTNLVLQNSYIVIMALGMLLVIVAGHIDLSVGSVAGFIGALAAVMMVQYEWHFVPAVIACLLAGAVIGAAQGYFVAFFRIPSFIVTLAGMLVFKGLALALLQGQSVGPFPEAFQRIASVHCWWASSWRWRWCGPRCASAPTSSSMACSRNRTACSPPGTWCSAPSSCC